MSFINILITLSSTVLIKYIWIIAFIAPRLNGDIALIILSFFAAQGLYPLWIVIIIPIIGNLAMDFCIIKILNSKGFSWIKDKTLHRSKKYFKIEKHIERIAHEKDWLIVFLAKFMYGARNLIFIYLSNRKFSPRKYVKLAIIPISLWVLIMTSIGYSLGLHFASINNVYEDIKLVFLYLGITIILLFVFTFLLKELIMKIKVSKNIKHKRQQRKRKKTH
jgi:membrane protein DedA with SNARE-associated domain